MTNSIYPLKKGDLENKVSLITGGSSGIGLATANTFLREGSSVSILALPDERLSKTREILTKQYTEARFIAFPCDLTNENEVISAFQKTLNHFGKLNIVVNNAGISVSAAVEDTTLADFEKILAINTTAVFIVSREAVRVFKKQDSGGVIVYVASDDAIKPSRHFIAYNASKAAVLQISRTIAAECGKYNIRTNSVLPGAVFGGSNLWTTEMRMARAKIHGFHPDNLEEEYKKNNALGVIINPEEVADVLLYLACDRTAKMTGNCLVIDGGGLGGYVR